MQQNTQGMQGKLGVGISIALCRGLWSRDLSHVIRKHRLAPSFGYINTLIVIFLENPGRNQASTTEYTVKDEKGTHT
jgi:hypothetical protein